MRVARSAGAIYGEGIYEPAQEGEGYVEEDEADATGAIGNKSSDVGDNGGDFSVLDVIWDVCDRPRARKETKRMG